MSQRWKICDHAKQRLDEMELSRRDVLTALKKAEVVYPGSLGHPPDRLIACWDRLAVVFNPATRTVITVLWRGIGFVRAEMTAEASASSRSQHVIRKSRASLSDPSDTVARG